MNKEIIVKKLLDSKYPEKQAESVAEELALLDNSLLDLLHKWVSDSIETDIIAENISLLDLKHKYQMTYPAALLTIDWLIKEPKVAIEAITRGIK